MSARAQYGSNGPSWEKFGIGGTIIELGPTEVKGGSIQEVARGPFLPRVANRPAAEPMQMQVVSGRQHYPRAQCCRRGNYPRVPAPPAWVSPNQEETTGPPDTESFTDILAHLKTIQTSEGPARIGRHTSGMRPSSQETAPKRLSKR